MSITSETLHLIRTATSLLFVPGDRTERFDKAVISGADLVILDLEDAVRPEQRPQARENIIAWLSGGGRAAVRINSVTSPDHAEDLRAIVGLPGLAAVMLAKADASSARTVGERARVPVIALIESCLGLAQAAAIAATPGIERIAFGHLDYAVDIAADPSMNAMLYARSALVQASKLAGIPGPIDGVTVALDDQAVLTHDIAHAREMGMTGKLLVHPRQVAGTREAFAPTEAQTRWAQRIVAASTQGAARVDGEMVDAPRVMRAQAILRRTGS